MPERSADAVFGPGMDQSQAPVPQSPGSAFGAETREGSLLQPFVWLEALLISACIHACVTGIFGIPPGAPIPLFILLAASDVVLIALTCVPLVAIRRRLLAWHDPLAYMGILFFLSSATFYAVYLLDASFVPEYVSFLGYNFSGASQATVLGVFIRAMMAQSTFLALVIVFNRRQLMPTYVRVGRNDEAYGLTVAGAILVGLGAFGVFKLRATPYFGYVIDNLGRSLSPPPGLARYILLAGVAAVAVSVFLVGWLNIAAPIQRKLSSWQSLLPAALVTASVIPGVLVGSRIAVLFTGFAAIATMRHFGYMLSRRVLAVLIIVVLAGGSIVTVLRANPGGESVATRVTSATSIAKLSGTRDRIANLALNVDRTGNTSLVIRQMDTRGHYLMGRSLIAGWDALFSDYGQRLGLISSDYQPVWTPQQYMEHWRFGQTTGTSPVPPGFAGEFYMDGGYVGVLLLGAAFAWLFAFFRRRMWRSASLTTRWLYVTGLLVVANAVLTQTSILAMQLGLTLATVVLVMVLFRLLFRLGRRSPS